MERVKKCRQIDVPTQIVNECKFLEKTQHIHVSYHIETHTSSLLLYRNLYFETFYPLWRYLVETYPRPA